MSTGMIVQWGVRYGDGEVELAGEARHSAEEFRGAIRRQIAQGNYDESDYEPMEIVTRTVRTTVTKTNWTPK